MKNFILLLFSLIVILTFSCSPAKRLNNILSKHPELLQKDTIEITVFHEDTIVIPGKDIFITNRDTIIKTDSFELVVTRDSIKYRFYPINHIIKDTIKVPSYIYKYKTEKVYSPDSIKYSLIIIAVCLLILLLRLILKKII